MAFHHALEHKALATVRDSDRRKLKDRVVAAFRVPQSVAESLVPQGIRSIKLKTYAGEEGIAYISPEAAGDPLWFTLDGAPNVFVPTIYTLWKYPSLLPCVSISSSMLSAISDGVDIMTLWPSPSVEQKPGTLIALARIEDTDSLGPAVAVGRVITCAQQTGEQTSIHNAVLFLHFWNDRLFKMGGTPDHRSSMGAVTSGDDGVAGELAPTTIDEAGVSLTGEEVSSILRKALLHAIRTRLSSAPLTNSIQTTKFYTEYILPARPGDLPPTSTPIDVKHSSFKSLTVFLRAAEKDGLLTLNIKGGQLSVTSVSPSHSDVQAHDATAYRTVTENADENSRVAPLEQGVQGEERQMKVVKLFKPNLPTSPLFQVCGKDLTALYTEEDVQNVVVQYATAKNLIAPMASREAYVSVRSDPVLSAFHKTPSECVSQGELAHNVSLAMTPHHRVLSADGIEISFGDGSLKPVEIVAERGSTVAKRVRSFLPDMEGFAQDVRRKCAATVAVKNSDIIAKGPKHINAIRGLLLDKGLHPEWIASKTQAQPKGKGKKT